MPQFILNNNPLFSKSFFNFYHFTIPLSVEVIFSFLLIGFHQKVVNRFPPRQEDTHRAERMEHSVHNKVLRFCSDAVLLSKK
jgi:hypothetical protein